MTYGDTQLPIVNDCVVTILVSMYIISKLPTVVVIKLELPGGNLG
jgi:hypothetical protein